MISTVVRINRREATLPDHRLPSLEAALDAQLQHVHSYAYARRLEQLGPVRVVRVRNGWSAYEAHLRHLGRRAGDIKPTALDRFHR